MDSLTSHAFSVMGTMPCPMQDIHDHLGVINHDYKGLCSVDRFHLKNRR
jgi:hypothetical protein